MISVIIPQYDDGYYLIRCLNCIKRQYYQDTEILIVNGECSEELIRSFNLKIIHNDDPASNGLDKAISSALGEYIFFCNVTSLLATNTFSELMSDFDDSFISIKEFVYDGSSFHPQDLLSFSVYGKLFKKDIILRNNLNFINNNLLSECLFVMQYISKFSKMRKKEDICIYNTDQTVCYLSREIFSSKKEWQACLQSIKRANRDIGAVLYKGFVKMVKDNDFCSKELMFLAEKEFHHDHELNYLCAVPVLKQLWWSVKENKDESALGIFKEFLSKYENETLLNLLLLACGLDARQYYYIKNDRISDVLFMIQEEIKLKADNHEVFESVRTIMNGQTAGLVKIGKNWGYYSNGKLDRVFRGMTKNEYGWWYVSDGTIDYDFEGLIRNKSGWWYISKGTIDKQYTGIAMNDYGVFMYVQNGKVKMDYTGLIETKEGYRYITMGIVNRDFVGLVKSSAGKWLYVENGCVNRSFMGLASNDYGWWFVEDGNINFEYNGYARNNLGWYKVKNGKAVEDAENEMIVKGLYETGQLGFKTIAKSISAWIKYKVK